MMELMPLIQVCIGQNQAPQKWSLFTEMVGPMQLRGGPVAGHPSGCVCLFSKKHLSSLLIPQRVLA